MFFWLSFDPSQRVLGKSYVLAVYVYIYMYTKYIYIYIYIYMVPPPRPILFDNSLLLFFFSMFKCVFFWHLFYIFKKLCRVVKTIPLIKLCSFNRMIFTKPGENQKNKKPKLFRECLVWGSCLFFCLFSSSFLFFLVMTLKKLKKLKVFLVFWKNWLLKNCEKPKTTQVFFVFCMDCCYMSSKNLSENQKKTEFFWFFTIL